MKVLIDIGHPAHIHLFKHFAWELERRKHSVLFTCRKREYVIELLTAYHLPYACFGKYYKKVVWKLIGLFINMLLLLWHSLRFRPDYFMSHSSTIAGVVSYFLRKPHIALEDTFNMEQVKWSVLFSDVVLTGDHTHPDLGPKELRYPGYHELAYLHPHRFAPNPSILEDLRINASESFVIIRFVAWTASHDVGHSGLSLENKYRLVQELSQHLTVFISSEATLPSELQQYQIRIKPECMHDALYYAKFLIGESGTMASECAMLGTQAIFLNNKHFGCIDDQASYHLIHTFDESPEGQEQAIAKAIELATSPDLKQQSLLLRDAMLKDKIDLTSFLVWFVLQYPASSQQMRGGSFDFSPFR